MSRRHTGKENKKSPTRSRFGDEKDMDTDLTVVPLQFPFSFSLRYQA